MIMGDIGGGTRSRRSAATCVDGADTLPADQSAGGRDINVVHAVRVLPLTSRSSSSARSWLLIATCYPSRQAAKLDTAGPEIRVSDGPRRTQDTKITTKKKHIFWSA